jgi:hypothetical protein
VRVPAGGAIGGGCSDLKQVKVVGVP